MAGPGGHDAASRPNLIWGVRIHGGTGECASVFRGGRQRSQVGKARRPQRVE